MIHDSNLSRVSFMHYLGEHGPIHNEGTDIPLTVREASLASIPHALSHGLLNLGEQVAGLRKCGVVSRMVGVHRADLLILAELVTRFLVRDIVNDIDQVRSEGPFDWG